MRDKQRLKSAHIQGESNRYESIGDTIVQLSKRLCAGSMKVDRSALLTGSNNMQARVRSLTHQGSGEFDAHCERRQQGSADNIYRKARTASPNPTLACVLARDNRESTHQCDGPR